MKNNIKQLIKEPSKKIFGVSDPRLLLKQFHTNIRKKIYREKFGTERLLALLDDLGIKQGDTIFVPSSWGEFYNFTDTPQELISSLKELIGLRGNLAMPSNTNLFQNNMIFNVRRTPTNAGILAEYFRRTKGVKRSIHLNSSICIMGPDAEEMTSTHEKSITSWDKFSPHHKLYEINAKVVSLGVGHFFTHVSPWHCVDSHLFRSNEAFRKLYPKKIQYTWEDENKGSGHGICYVRSAKQNLKYLNRYIKDVPHSNAQIANLKVYTTSLKPLIEKGIELGKEGITLYGKI